MDIRSQINSIFDGKAFKRPLFYNCEGGLRFELSEGGTYLNQFLTAHKKGMEVCDEIFSSEEVITVCVRIFGGKSLASRMSVVKKLSEAGLFPEGAKEHWTEIDEEWEGDEDYLDKRWHYIAFEAPKERLVNSLWCALSTDFGYIEPNPSAIIYLFNLQSKLMIFPYDDRGMDVVGVNNDQLKELYNKFNHYLLDYDREAMDVTFS